MDILNYRLESGTMNQIYDKIKNCRVVKPPYETDGYYSNDFFLDKRLDLSSIYSDNNKTFYDYIDIKGIRYYLYKELNKHFIGVLNNGSLINITPNGFNITDNSPINIAFAKGINGQGELTPRNTLAATSEIGGEVDWELIPGYAGGYVKFKYSGTQNIQVGDYIVFNEGTLLAGAINRIEHIDNDNNIYIIGTNARGTIPETGSEFYLYKSINNGGNTEDGTTIIIGHQTGLSLIIFNGINTVKPINVLTTSGEEIIDIVNFDGNIFALTNNRMYFSRSTFNDNSQFYPLDNYFIDGGYKLFSIGKALLCFGRTNKLFSSANSTGGINVGYVGYDVNYNGDLFSKYSFIFDDQTIYVLQKDKQLKQISIQQNNATTFDLLVTDVIPLTKGLFESLDYNEGNVYINSNQRYLNFLYVTEDKTINYQYDKTYQHFIENEYGYQIYKFNNNILSKGNIFIEEGYGDYQQEINFSIDTGLYMFLPYILRTHFGMIDTELDIQLNIKFEIGGTIDIIEKRLSGFVHDLRLSNSLTGDELLEDSVPTEQITYNGTTVSVQSNILKLGRFIKFKYSSDKRFQIGNSFIVYDETNLFINEPLFTN